MLNCKLPEQCAYVHIASHGVFAETFAPIFLLRKAEPTDSLWRVPLLSSEALMDKIKKF